MNYTIDDEIGAPITGIKPEYSAPSSIIWNQGSTCHTCSIQLNTSRTFDGTWHDITVGHGDSQPANITIRFKGTAVYVFNVLANNVTSSPSSLTPTNITFTLDGQMVGTYNHIPTASTEFQYNVPVYKNTTLENVGHELVIRTAGPDAVLILFDYVIYTVPSTSSSSITVSVIPRNTSFHSRQ